ncbi:MAG: cardiolipin synthase [Planctomycetota bacterium]|jgi:cardiolipin synthase
MVTILWSILTYVFLIGGFLLGIVLIAHILLQKRPPSGTIAWLLVILFMPWVGVPLYLIFGGRKVRKHVERKGSLDLDGQTAIDAAETNVIDRILRSYNIPGAEAGHHIDIRPTGIDRFNTLKSLLENAQQNIYLSTFIYHDDHVGREILSILTDKARAGLDVRLLVDGLGSIHTRRRFFKPFIDAGGKFAVFMPVLHRPWRGRTNLRNHRKITIVDNQKVLSGGTNIGNQYMGPAPYENRWKDLAFVLQGPAVKHWLNIFADDWHFAAKESIPAENLQTPEQTEPPGDAIVQIVPSGPDIPSDALHHAIVSMVFEAKKRFWVVTPYFVPDDALTGALTLAARRGVDVRIILPVRSNHLLPDIVRGIPLRQIQSAGGMIMRYTPRMLHAKILLKDDDIAVLGSANMDIRSLLLNYEAAMLVCSKPDVEKVADYIEDLALASQCGIAEASLPRALAESAVRLVSPLL